MPRTSVSQWSTTAGDNSDVGSINIAEGCPASHINNALREIMAQVATAWGGLGLKDLTAAEIDRIRMIGGSTIGAAQWGHLEAMDQGVATTDTPAFGGLIATGPIVVDNGVAINLKESGGAARAGMTMNGSNVMVVGDANTPMTFDAAANRFTNAATFASVNGISSALLTEIAGFTTTELQQLKHLAEIDATAIGVAQWGYLGAMNQGVASTDTPTFVHVKAPQGIPATHQFHGGGSGTVTNTGSGAYRITPVAGIGLSGGRFTVPAGGGGVWALEAGAQYVGSCTNPHGYIARNAVRLKFSNRPNSGRETHTLLSTVVIVELADGDVVDWQVYDGRAGTVDFLHFAGCRLGVAI